MSYWQKSRGLRLASTTVIPPELYQRMFQNKDFDSRQSGLQSRLCHSAAVRPWATRLISLSLGFHIHTTAPLAHTDFLGREHLRRLSLLQEVSGTSAAIYFSLLWASFHRSALQLSVHVPLCHMSDIHSSVLICPQLISVSFLVSLMVSGCGPYLVQGLSGPHVRLCKISWRVTAPKQTSPEEPTRLSSWRGTLCNWLPTAVGPQGWGPLFISSSSASCPHAVPDTRDGLSLYFWNERERGFLSLWRPAEECSANHSRVPSAEKPCWLGPGFHFSPLQLQFSLFLSFVLF